MTEYSYIALSDLVFLFVLNWQSNPYVDGGPYQEDEEGRHTLILGLIATYSVRMAKYESRVFSVKMAVYRKNVTPNKNVYCSLRCVAVLLTALYSVIHLNINLVPCLYCLALR